MALSLFINFTFTACDENKELPDQNNVDYSNGANIDKATLSELTDKIGDRDLKIISLIKNNPVSKLKNSNLEKKNTTNSEFYFDTDNIMALKFENTKAVYIIPAYKSNNVRDNNLYSISININDSIIDTKLTTTEIDYDGFQKFITSDFNYTLPSASKMHKNDEHVALEMQCFCTVRIFECSCCSIHAIGGCNHPQMFMSCDNCSGTSNSNPSTGYNPSIPLSSSQITILSSSGSNSGYTYNLTGNSIYIGLMKKYKPDYVFSALQKYNIINTPEITNPFLQFLDTDGTSQMNKDFGVSIIDAIEEGTVTNYMEFAVLLNAYKKTREFIAFKNQFFIENPTATEAQFENWFGGSSEGQDGDYDVAYWENPNLTFPHQELPTYNNYLNGMPRFADGSFMIGADNVYALVGGAVQQARIDNPKRTENTCALKVSIALNRAGVIIPNLPGKTLEGTGEFAGKYFFLNAKSLNSWMRETFGTSPENINHFSYTSSDGGTNGINFPKKLKDKNGIYSMITTEKYTRESGISGHADLIFNGSSGKGTCIFGCSFNLPVERIDIWILN